MTPDDTFIVISTSGKNAVPVEAAIEAGKIGVKTIGIVSSAYFDDEKKTDKLLYECVDTYIDNCVPHGDAVVDIYNTETKMGSVSTAASSFILQSILLEAADKSAHNNIELPIYMSGNVDGGAEHNKKIIDKYLSKIKHL